MTEQQIQESDRATIPIVGGNTYGNIHVAGTARAQLGDIITLNYHYNDRDQEEPDLFLKNLYYGSMNARKTQIHDAKDTTCEWIWTTSFPQWLAEPASAPFWLFGKPGSGKSTLIKYLGRIMAATAVLSTAAHERIVIDFYFDFRQAEQTGNSLYGLLRSMLYRITSHIQGFRQRLHVVAGTDLNNDHASSLASLSILLKDALQSTPAKFFLLVDGLDEFSGDMLELLGLLKELSTYSNLKLCLASRPETLIRERFATFPKLNMSEHNVDGIQRYVNTTASEFQPYLDALLLPDIQQVILDKAEGVFLWVYLAVGDVMKACVDGATADEIKERLSALPMQIEALYQRIVDRIPQSIKSEAAVLYTIIMANDQMTTVDHLHSIFSFLATELSIGSLPGTVNTREHFERRLNSAMGGLVEVVSSPSQGGISTHLGACHVRLIHETVRSFSKRTMWMEKLLPQDFRTMFPDRVIARLCFKALLAGEHKMQTTENDIYSPTAGYHLHELYSADHISQWIRGSNAARWAALLQYSIMYVMYHAEKHVCVTEDAFQHDLELAMRSRLASTHFVLGDPIHITMGYPTTAALCAEVSDLTLAATHGCYHYLRTKEHRIKGLRDSQRDELVSNMLRHTVYLHKACLEVYRSKGSGDWEELRNSVNVILLHNKAISRFHLCIFVMLSYKDIPPYLVKQLAQGRQRMLSLVQRVGLSHHTPPFAHNPPIFVWACDKNNVSESNRVADEEKQLQDLLQLCTDINFKDSEGRNIVHYLITDHIIGHTFLEPYNSNRCIPNDDFALGCAKLYLVEKAGADFSVQFEHRTPLQAFRYGLDRIQATPKDKLIFGDFPLPAKRFAHLEFVLEHKEHTGHLPQPNTSMERDSGLRMRCEICIGLLYDAHRHGNADRSFIPSRRAPQPPSQPHNSIQTQEETHTPELIVVPEPPKTPISLSNSPKSMPVVSSGSKDPDPPTTINTTSSSPRLTRSPGYLQPTTSSRQRELLTKRARSR